MHAEVVNQVDTTIKSRPTFDLGLENATNMVVECNTHIHHIEIGQGEAVFQMMIRTSIRMRMYIKFYLLKTTLLFFQRFRC